MVCWGRFCEVERGQTYVGRGQVRLRVVGGGQVKVATSGKINYNFLQIYRGIPEKDQYGEHTRESVDTDMREITSVSCRVLYIQCSHGKVQVVYISIYFLYYAISPNARFLTLSYALRVIFQSGLVRLFNLTCYFFPNNSHDKN